MLRQGRVSNAQQRSLDTLLPQFGIPYSGQALDLEAAFGRKGTKVLEIGFGMGETTAAIAAAHPDIDYIAIEVHSPGVGSLLKQIEEAGLTNLRIIQHDAVEVIQNMLAPDSLDGVHLFFPDPWPKKRHHKRRLLQPPFCALIASRIRPGGYFHSATDWEEYAQQMLEVLSAEAQLENTAAGYAERPGSRPLTKFEQRGLRLGHRVWDLIFRRK